MFVDRYEPKTNQHFILLKVGFQFHFNRFNGGEKIVGRKNDNIHPSIHPHRLNEKVALLIIIAINNVYIDDVLKCKSIL